LAGEIPATTCMALLALLSLANSMTNRHVPVGYHVAQRSQDKHSRCHYGGHFGSQTLPVWIRLEAAKFNTILLFRLAWPVRQCPESLPARVAAELRAAFRSFTPALTSATVKIWLKTLFGLRQGAFTRMRQIALRCNFIGIFQHFSNCHFWHLVTCAFWNLLCKCHLTYWIFLS
jgi:hypothetical protein